MNELPSSSEQSTSASPASSRDSAARNASLRADGPSSTKPAARTVYGSLAVLAILLAGQWWHSHSEISSLREEMAQRLRTGESLNTETKVMVKSVQDGMKELQAKVNVLENKQTEAQSQQLALEQMYQELSRNSDDWALAEIEQVLSTASQQLQLAGNVQGALIALQNADNRLSRSDKPQFITIRRAIGKDMERLKALPTVDLTGIALRLDSIIGQVDGMPLLSDEKPVVPAAQPKAPRHAARDAAAKTDKAQPGAATGWLAGLQEKWNGLTAELWAELSQLMRVRNVETPDALLLSPTQAYYARENLKLRLLNARLALLARNEAMFRNDLIAAQEAIAKYFDTRAKQTQTAQALLRQVQASNLSIEMPTLAESLNAVRNYKAKP